MINREDVTEQVIARAGLSKEEARVARAFLKINTAGRKTRRWVNVLSNKKYNLLLSSAIEKIKKFLNKRAEN